MKATSKSFDPQPVLEALAAIQADLDRVRDLVEQAVPKFDPANPHNKTADGKLSEEGATPEKVAKVVGELLDDPAGVVVCTHRPVLPAIWDAVGLPGEKLEPAGMLVVHHRKGRVVATEVHQRP